MFGISMTRQSRKVANLHNVEEHQPCAWSIKLASSILKYNVGESLAPNTVISLTVLIPSCALC
jgi:hypothetical protein